VSLQGYFDDSGSHAGDPVFMVAGFVSTADKWKTFCEEWRTKLDEYPKIRYFKMREAMSLRGQFERGWTPALRDQRVLELCEIIRKHAELCADSWLYRVNFDDLVANIVDLPEFNSPYGACFYQLIFALVTYLMERGGRESLELIFDKQSHLSERMMLYWDFSKEYVPQNQHEQRKQALDRVCTPAFRDDVKSLPLQAADMWAWTLHHHLVPDPNPKPIILCEAIKKIIGEVPMMSRVYDPNGLQVLGARLMVWRARSMGLL
jgi:hypothetical protein